MGGSERPRGSDARTGGGSPPETRDEAVARLESDLEKLRALLREHMLQREAVEEELRASGEQYRLLAEHMEDLVTLHAEDGTILYVSPSSTRLTGIPAHEYLKGEVFGFIHPE